MSGSHTASCGALHSPGLSSAEAGKGAKDDSRGTFVLADSLRTDQHGFRAIRASDPSIIRLRELSRLDEELSFCFQRHCAQLRQQLQRFFPHVLGLSQTADEPWIWALLELAPTPAKAAKLTLKRIEKLLRQCKIRRIEAAEVAAVLRDPAFSLSAGTAEAASEHVLMLLPHLGLLHQRRWQRASNACSMKLSAKGESQPPSNVQVLLSLPGVGRIVTGTLLSEAPHLIAERDYHGLQALAGVAPVTRQSGKRAAVMIRGLQHSATQRPVPLVAGEHAERPAQSRALSPASCQRPQPRSRFA